MEKRKDTYRHMGHMASGGKKSRFCHLCGEPIQGSYLVYGNGLVVCKRCDQTVPHCSQCKVPSRQLTIARGLPICPDCRQKAPVCACCNELILGNNNYYIVGDSPERYCESCIKTQHRCDVCRVPFLPDKGKVFKGRDGLLYRCASCLRSAIMTLKEAERLYEATNAMLKRELGLEVSVLPTVHLVERATLIELHQQADAHSGSNIPDTPLGPEHQHLLGFFQRINDRWDIYIEQLLPEPLFRAVAAHELAHAWQSTHTPQGQSLKIVEGFAEWVAYRILLSLGLQRDAARLTRRSDLYGDGLQYFIAQERDHGRAGVLQRAAQ